MRSAESVADPHANEACAQCLRDLKRNQSRLKQFANAIGHDFQEPLRMVVSYSQLVEQRYGTQLDAQARPLMDFAVQGAMRINALLHALCECMEIESADHTRGEVDCDEALDSAVASLQATMFASHAAIERGKMPRVVGGGARLEQVFRHLIDNAIKFNTSAEPFVQITAEPDADNWVFSVKDNGIGIEPAQMEKAFKIFKRLHGPKYPGAGIGLTICSTIVERHGGRLWAESVPGQGSTFHFTLPRHS
jgi:light-regulated signal transduction histidine kinase (bacteriophytochrome)